MLGAGVAHEGCVAGDLHEVCKGNRRLVQLLGCVQLWRQPVAKSGSWRGHEGYVAGSLLYV